MDVYQCCYTHASRVTGNTASAGWQAVAVSPEAPQEAVRACTRLQNAGSPNRPGVVDEAGRVLDLLELSGDGSCLYVIRTRYGQTDSLGRPSMFSHGFIFSLKDPEVLYDPNVFLGIDRSAFKTDEEEAARWDGTLPRAEPLELSAALERLGLDRERYAVLVRCVYAQMSEEKNPKPLYVWYDGTEEQLRLLLYCVYSGIPTHLRKNLGIASSANAVNLKKNLIFSGEARNKEYWLIPRTGENNLLTSRMEGRISRSGYIDHAVLELPFGDFPAFFRELDRIAGEFGDLSASNELVLRLAFQFLARNGNAASFSDEELESSLSAAFRCGAAGEKLEDHAAGMLEEINRRGLWLAKETEAAMERRLSGAKQERLKRAAVWYDVRRYEQMPVEEAAGRLRKLPLFPLYRERLAGTDHGREILLYYYREILEKEASDWNALFRLWAAEGNPAESGGAAALHEHINGQIRQKAMELYRRDVGKDAVSALSEYERLMKQILPKERYRESIRLAKENFWKQVSFSNFAFDEIEQYERFRLETKECKMYLAYGSLAEFYYPSVSANLSLLQELYQFFGNHVLIPARDKREAIDHLYAYLRQRYGEQVPEDFLSWMIMASGADTDELIKRIKNLYDAAARFQTDRLVDEYPKFWNACRHAKNTAYIRTALPEVLEGICRRHDTPEHPVPLDLWLRVGESRGRNCFEILDEANAAVLDTEPVKAVRESRLMKLLLYREAAQMYIEKQGEKSKAVRWLNEGRYGGSAPAVEPHRAKGFLSIFRK